jgi:hypothetical protein
MPQENIVTAEVRSEWQFEPERFLDSGRALLCEVLPMSPRPSACRVAPLSPSPAEPNRPSASAASGSPSTAPRVSILQGCSRFKRERSQFEARRAHKPAQNGTPSPEPLC